MFASSLLLLLLLLLLSPAALQSSCSFETTNSVRVRMLGLHFQAVFEAVISEYKYMNIMNVAQNPLTIPYVPFQK